MNPYGGYGPAQAIKDTSESLSDVIKAFAGIKLREAQLDLEGKKIDLETQKAKGQAEKELALSEFAAATEEKNIRLQGQQLAETARQNTLANRHNVEMEKIGNRTADSQAAMAKVHAREVGLKEAEIARLNAPIKWGDAVMKSALTPDEKEAIKYSTPEDGWNQQVRLGDFKDFIENVQKSPKAVYGGVASRIYRKLEDIKERAKTVKTPEEGAAIAEQWREGTHYALTIYGVIGEGPGPLNAKQEELVMNNARAVYELDQKEGTGKYPGGLPQAIVETRAGAQKAHDAYWSDNFGPDQIKGLVNKALEREAKFDPDAQAKVIKQMKPEDQKKAMTKLKTRLPDEEFGQLQAALTGKTTTTRKSEKIVSKIPGSGKQTSGFDLDLGELMRSGQSSYPGAGARR